MSVNQNQVKATSQQPLTASTRVNKPEPNRHIDLVRDLLELLVENKRKENQSGMRAAFNDLSSLQKKFDSLKQSTERKSDLLRRIVACLVPSTSKLLLNDLSKLLCDYYHDK